MSKVILKIGPKTEFVPAEDIITISYGSFPKTTIKYAKDRSTIIFERNPFRVIITEEKEVNDICHFLEQSQTVECERESARYKAMASMNIESIIAAYISRTLFEDFSESLVNALRNSKQVGMNIEKNKNDAKNRKEG